MSKVLIKNIGTLQTPVGSYAHKGAEQGENLVLKNAAILIDKGIITEIISGDGANIKFRVEEEQKEADSVIDADGHLVTPGLVESHTHMIFGGYRQHELPKKLRGATYLDILREGGGINDTVRATRASSFEELYEKTSKFLDEVSSFGVTTCEIKSGYGLDFDTEVKCLEVLKKLNQEHPLDVVSTFMGAHALPPEFKGNIDEGKPDDKEGFFRLMNEKLLPYIAEHDLADFVDIFIEEEVFSVEEGRAYLEKAKELGYDIKVHADEIKSIGGTELAGEMKAKSAEHLIVADSKGIEALAKGGTVAVCLPGTSFYLGSTFAPVREMIEKEVPVAIATDFNPGSCPCLNLQLMMNLAILKYKMLPEEILTAVTVNAAAALNMENIVGTVEVGKQADLAIWSIDDFNMACYRYGSNLVKKTIKKGELI
ncbi:MAG: imidazolonepropionase [Clostridiales bacterium]|nr:imidazolonepropionase [Clostridiales bacterium]